MPTITTPEEAAAFIERFNHFYDGAFLRAQVDWTQEHQQQVVTIEVDVRDMSIPSYPYTALKITFYDAAEVRIEEIKSTLARLCYGLSILIQSDDIFVAFDDDLETPEQFVAPDIDFYVKCKIIAYEILPDHDTALGKYAQPWKPRPEGWSPI